MAATLKRPEEAMPPLISRACGGSISARGSSDAVRSDSRPRTARRHPVERQLAEGQLLHVEDHKRRVAEQRHELLAQLDHAMALQAEQTERAQRAVQAERR